MLFGHVLQVNGLSHILLDLEEFVLYNFYVSAHNENGAGEATEEVMARTFSDGKIAHEFLSLTSTLPSCINASARPLLIVNNANIP